MTAFLRLPSGLWRALPMMEASGRPAALAVDSDPDDRGRCLWAAAYPHAGLVVVDSGVILASALFESLAMADASVVLPGLGVRGRVQDLAAVAALGPLHGSKQSRDQLPAVAAAAASGMLGRSVTAINAHLVLWVASAALERPACW